MLSPVPSSTTEFRIADPFDAAVLWHIFLYCDSCGKDCDSAEDGGSGSITQSLPSYHATAQNAKDAGWYISDRHGATAEWDILCPTCAAEQGRHLSDRASGATSSEMVRAFYQALTRTHRVKATRASNQAMERTATRRAFTVRVAWTLSPRPTRALGGRRSSCSR